MERPSTEFLNQVIGLLRVIEEECGEGDPILETPEYQTLSTTMQAMVARGVDTEFAIVTYGMGKDEAKTVQDEMQDAIAIALKPIYRKYGFNNQQHEEFRAVVD